MYKKCFFGLIAAAFIIGIVGFSNYFLMMATFGGLWVLIIGSSFIQPQAENDLLSGHAEHEPLSTGKVAIIRIIALGMWATISLTLGLFFHMPAVIHAYAAPMALLIALPFGFKVYSNAVKSKDLREWLVYSTAIKLLMSYIASVVYFYFSMPALTGPLGGWTQIVVFIIVGRLAMFFGENISFRFFDKYAYHDNPGFTATKLGSKVSQLRGLPFCSLDDESSSDWIKRAVRANSPWLASLIMITFAFVASAEMFRAKEYAALPTVVEKQWSSNLQPVDLSKLPKLTPDSALEKGERSIDQYGSTRMLKEATKQLVKGKAVYVLPLHPDGLDSWMYKPLSEGYLVVDAVDHNASVKVVDFKKVKYLHTAYFNNNLYRHIYFSNPKYRKYRLRDLAYELSDEGEEIANGVHFDESPLYAVLTLTQPSIGYDGEVVKGVLVVNTETGEMKDYEPGKQPAWVDRVIPEELAVDYVNWYGRYSQGWMATKQGDKQHMFKLTETSGEKMTIMWDAEGEPMFVSGFTSVNASDATMKGVVTVNCKTGITTIYTDTIGKFGGDESKAMSIVSSKKIGKKYDWQPSHPMMVNLKTKAYVVPVFDAKNYYIGTSIVSAGSDNMIPTAIHANIQDAYAEYESILASQQRELQASKHSHMVEVGSVITAMTPVVIDGTTHYYIKVQRFPDFTFVASVKMSNYLVETKVGDTVILSFRQNGTHFVLVEHFANYKLLNRKVEELKKDQYTDTDK